ncbi:hypothetical protein EV356DRAFT_574915 [Viridothelium virens]|uniref:Cora-domain-containing protein n=1 Tax=Viridothelium virens TaxID=1048519 RepID=A0A6A6HER7_VIRVR|nr:hypothetical protein EV356DRAFT_574915 [Viridothelium virens]
MQVMTDIVEDESRYYDFANKVSSRSRNETDELNLNIVEWSRGQQYGAFSSFSHVAELEKQVEKPLRVIFAPLDIATDSNVGGLLRLFRHLAVPSDFLNERIHSVTCGFGSRPRKNGHHCLWFHFLCKDIEVDEHDEIKHRDVNHNHLNLSQADYVWQRAGFFLSWRDYHSLTLNDGPRLSEDEDYDPQQHHRFDNVTLCCWGVPRAMEERFAEIAYSGDWKEALEDPFILVTIILDQLFSLMDKQKQNLRRAVNKIELDTLLSAKSPSSMMQSFDFVAMSNVAKHIDHLGCGAILETVDAICRHHIKYFIRNPSHCTNRVFHLTEDAFEHKAMLFKSLNFQVQSMEKKMRDMANLAFNLVTQQSNTAVIDDSRSMRTIATVTLIFLPFAAVAAMFSTPFFANTPNTSVWVSPDFGTFWAIVVPMTAVVLLCWDIAYFVAAQKVKLNREGTGPRHAFLTWLEWHGIQGRRREKVNTSKIGQYSAAFEMSNIP